MLLIMVLLVTTSARAAKLWQAHDLVRVFDALADCCETKRHWLRDTIRLDQVISACLYV